MEIWLFLNKLKSFYSIKWESIILQYGIPLGGESHFGIH